MYNIIFIIDVWEIAGSDTISLVHINVVYTKYLMSNVVESFQSK
jgi:hypothetical protein